MAQTVKASEIIDEAVQAQETIRQLTEKLTALQREIGALSSHEITRSRVGADIGDTPAAITMFLFQDIEALLEAFKEKRHVFQGSQRLLFEDAFNGVSKALSALNTLNRYYAAQE